MIHPGARLGEIGEPDPERDQASELTRLIAPQRDPSLVDRAPEAVAGMGVIVAEFGRTRRGGGADEDEAEVGAELVGEAVGRHVISRSPPERRKTWGRVNFGYRFRDACANCFSPFTWRLQS